MMRTLLAAAVALPLMSAPAFASAQEDAAACTQKIAEAKPDARVKLEKTRGSSTRTMTFAVIDGDARDIAVCKVRRGDVKELSWGE